MKFQLLLLLSAASLTLGSPIDSLSSIFARADNSAAVLADINKLNQDVVALNKTLNTLADNAPSIPGNTLVKLQNQNTAIENAIAAATKTTKASDPFTGPEANKIIAAILNIQPVTFSLLDNVVAHKPAFANSDVTSIVLQDLQAEKAKVGQLGPAIAAKVPAKYKKQAPIIEKNFATHFQNAINALSS